MGSRSVYRRHWLSSQLLSLVALLGLAATGPLAWGEGLVLLSNGNVLPGQALLIGPTVIIQREDGSELQIPASQFQHAAATMQQLHAFRLQQNPPRSFSDHLSNARWCLRHQLVQEMEASLTAAEALDPTHPELVYLRRQWRSQQMLAQVSDSGGNLNDVTHALGYQAAVDRLAPAVQIQPANPEIADPDKLAEHNLTPQAMNAFVNHLQPLLVSRCGNAGCHRSPAESAQWELTHMGTHRRPSPRMTDLNVIRTLEQITLDEAQASPLLLYANQPHGGDDRSDRYQPADQRVHHAIQQWIAILLYDRAQPTLINRMNQLEEEAAGQQHQPQPLSTLDRHDTTTPLLPSSANAIQQVAYWDQIDRLEASEIDATAQAAQPAVARAADGGRGQSNAQNGGNAQNVGSGASPAAAAVPGGSRPVRLPAVDNPVDPEIFNRHYRSNSGAR